MIDLITFPQLPSLTLRQAATLVGYDSQVALARAAGVNSSVVSAMFRGSHEYPKARIAVARLLFPTLQDADADGRLLRLIENSRPVVG